MKSSVRGRRGRLKWVGQPVPAPQSQTRSRSPSGRQKHYRAVELVGTGEVVFVDDVVEVSEQQKKSSATSSGPSSNEPHQHQPRLAQVQSMWEDTFTAAYKFRARWLIREADLPEDALGRLRKSRKANTRHDDSNISSTSSSPSSATSEMPSGKRNDNARRAKPKEEDDCDEGIASPNDEVFLTPRTEDLELRMIAKPASLSVTTPSAELETETTQAQPPKKVGKRTEYTPRLTHAFSPSGGGEFSALPNGDPILTRARIRHAEAAAAASPSTAKEGGSPTTVVKREHGTLQGWLPQKKVVRSLATRGRGRGRGQRSGGPSRDNSGPCAGSGALEESSGSAPDRSRLPSSGRSTPEQNWSEESDATSEPKANPGDANDESWEEGDDNMSESDGDGDSDLALDFAKNDGGPTRIASSASDESKAPNVKDKDGDKDAHGDDADNCLPRKSVRQQKSQRSSVAPSPSCALSSTVDVITSANEGTAINDKLKFSTTDITAVDIDSNPHQSTRRLRAPASKRQGPLPPRPRRLAMPPVLGSRVDASGGNTAAPGVAKTSTVPTSILYRSDGPTVKTRFFAVADGSKVYPTRSRSPVATAGEGGPPTPYISGKRKRGSGAAGSACGKASSASSSQGEQDQHLDYPPRRTPVGPDYQAEIPDLLPPDQREPPVSARSGTRMVWRSTRDWDRQSRALLGQYMHAVNSVAQVKQARQGVAVHVRLGATPINNSGTHNGQTQSDEMNGSYAIWALTAGRDTAGRARVGCSEKAQTEVPRSSIQRVSCEEEALHALFKSTCALDNFTPAVRIFGKDNSSPESVQPWAFSQSERIVASGELPMGSGFRMGGAMRGTYPPGAEGLKRMHLIYGLITRIPIGSMKLEVRTLEKVLEKEFDPNRHSHTCARRPTDMDREDFIDLNRVSEQIPGKTPAQVLSFYYKYLAAAEPLTDVLFGKQAAEARKQEPLGNIRQLSPQFAPAWDGNRLQRGDDSNGGSGEIFTTPTLSPPVRQVQQQQQPMHPPPPPLPNCVRSSTGNGRDDVNSNRGSMAVNGIHQQGQQQQGQRQAQRRRIGREGAPPRAPPPGAEVLEVIDDDSSDEASGRGVAGSSVAMTTKGRSAGTPTGAATAPPWRHAGAGGDGNTWVARQKAARGQVQPGACDAAPRQQPSSNSTTLSISPRAAQYNNGGSGLSPSRSPSHAPLPRPGPNPRPIRPAQQHPGQAPSHGYRTDEHWDSDRERGMGMERGSETIDNAGYPDTEFCARDRWEGRPQTSPPRVHGRPPSDGDDHHRHGSGGFGSGGQGIGSSENGYSVPRGGGSHGEERGEGRVIGRGSGRDDRHVSRDGPMHEVSWDGDEDDAMFGHMTPCWRLLEKAQRYMDDGQVKYMRGLLLAHVKKPMSREQVLIRAKSCLDEQPQIFGAFVKMFDRIEEPLMVPLYPSSTKSSITNPNLSPSRTPTTPPFHHSRHHHSSTPGGNAPVTHGLDANSCNNNNHDNSFIGGRTLRVPTPPSLAIEISSGQTNNYGKQFSCTTDGGGIEGGGGGGGSRDDARLEQRMTPMGPSLSHPSASFAPSHPSRSSSSFLTPLRLPHKVDEYSRRTVVPNVGTDMYMSPGHDGDTTMCYGTASGGGGSGAPAVSLHRLPTHPVDLGFSPGGEGMEAVAAGLGRSNTTPTPRGMRDRGYCGGGGGGGGGARGSWGPRSGIDDRALAAVSESGSPMLRSRSTSMQSYLGARYEAAQEHSSHHHQQYSREPQQAPWRTGGNTSPSVVAAHPEMADVVVAAEAAGTAATGAGGYRDRFVSRSRWGRDGTGIWW